MKGVPVSKGSSERAVAGQAAAIGRLENDSRGTERQAGLSKAMSRQIEIAVVIVGTALMFMLWVVMIAVVLLPATWVANWWLDDEVAVLAHPRHNALVLGFCVMIGFIVRAFSPTEMGSPDPPGRIWWWQRNRR